MSSTAQPSPREFVEEEIIVREPAAFQEVETITVEILPTGLYTIRTVPALQLVGRNLVEDASFGPKGIFGQPLGVPLSENTTFLLRHAGDQSYYITVGEDRGRVVQLEGRVAVVLHDVVDMDPYDILPVNQRWAVRRQPQHGDDIYTIESENGYWGWMMPTEHPQYTPVAVRQLAATATMPPMYPPTMLWFIERVG